MTTCAQRISAALNDADTNSQQWQRRCEILEQSNLALKVQIASLEDDNENLRAERLKLLALAYPVRSV